MFDVHSILIEATQNHEARIREGIFSMLGKRLWFVADSYAQSIAEVGLLRSMVGTSYDPYHSDANIDRFLHAIMTGEIDV